MMVLFSFFPSPSSVVCNELIKLSITKMKLNQAAIVASLSISAAAATAAASLHEDLKDNLLPTLLTQESVDYLHRMLSITDQCIDDTEAILSYGYLYELADLFSSCPQAQRQSGNTLTIDYSVCDPDFTDSYTDLCEENNGQLVSGVGDISLTCTLYGETIKVKQKGIPECLATSCDVMNWEAEKDEMLDEAVEEIKTMLEADGVECTFNRADISSFDSANENSFQDSEAPIALAVTSLAAILLL